MLRDITVYADSLYILAFINWNTVFLNLVYSRIYFVFRQRKGFNLFYLVGDVLNCLRSSLIFYTML